MLLKDGEQDRDVDGPYREAGERPDYDDDEDRTGVVAVNAGSSLETAWIRLLVALIALAGPVVNVWLVQQAVAIGDLALALGALCWSVSSYVFAALLLVDRDMLPKTFKDMSARSRVIAIAWAPAFFICYASYRAGRWIARGE